MKKPTILRALCISVALAVPFSIAGAQSADSNAAAYSQLLSQIADKKLTLLQKQAYTARQEQQIAFLKDEISGVAGTTGNVDEMLAKMVAQTERAIMADLPFEREKRLNRINKLKNDLSENVLSVGDKYRLALSALTIEANYGMSVEDYEGERPLNDGESQIMAIKLDAKGEPVKDEFDEVMGEQAEWGTYLRYGRVALVYMDQRLLTARRYDAPSGKWVDAAGSDLLEIRKAIRVARGEVAPTVVMAPTHTQ